MEQVIFWLAVVGCVYGFAHPILIIWGYFTNDNGIELMVYRKFVNNNGGIIFLLSELLKDWQTWLGIVSLITVINI